MAIDDVTIRLLIASNVGDADAVSQLFTDDALLLQSGEPAVRGSEEVRSRLQASFAKCSYDAEAFGDETVVSDRWAFNWGTYVTTVTPKAGGEAATVGGHFLNVFRRQADGSWKIARHVRDREDDLPASCL